ncbi:MAG: tRNA pseudouridine(55) synthase TruB, partial [Gallicola sp.]|nr:tRNA pseudouridine(55) synthase TruB [Gallicola sp.]
IADYIQKDVKEYIAVVKFGIQTDTYDVTGEIVNHSEVLPNLEEVEEALGTFKGSILQEPPMYSALKHKGKKLYELARQGITVERKKRAVTIYEIEVLDFLEKGKFKIRVLCSAGTYIRSLCNDLGLSLGTFGTMEELERAAVGEYKIHQCMEVDVLRNTAPEDLKKLLIPIEVALREYLAFQVPDFFCERLLNGVAYRVDNENNNLLTYRVYCKGQFIGLGKIEETHQGSVLKVKTRF